MLDYTLIPNFITDELINHYLELSAKYDEHESKVGTRVGIEKKIRKDKFFNIADCKKIDEFLETQKPHINQMFGVDVNFRERYKMGIYKGTEKGFYNQHTDTQGGHPHRQLSMVICLSNKDDYEGGIFNLISKKKQFKFDKGDAIIFRSRLLHAVDPVCSGLRQVLISFFWDHEGEAIRTKVPPVNNVLNYIPNCIRNKPPVLEAKNIPRIISYSLWGDSEIYNYTLVENILIAKTLCPEFRIHVHYNKTVLPKMLKLLNTFDNVVLHFIDNNYNKASNMLWRFKPCFYTNSIVFIRDADSLLTDRDLFTMYHFINSKYNIQSCKDSIHHLKYKICGGMWGCKNGILNTPVYQHYYTNYTFIEDVRGVDRDLLKRVYNENIDTLLLYIPANLQFKVAEPNIEIISVTGPPLCSYNYYAPLTRKLLCEENTKLTVKRNYAYQNAKKYISFIPPDSGPGNQIIGIKECLILANVLNRTCIIPPIREHYLKSNVLFYNFNDIFAYNSTDVIVDNKMYSLIQNTNIEKIYSFIPPKNTPSRHETLLKLKYEEQYLTHRKIKNDTCEELRQIDDKLLMLKHLFNNVYISNCSINGCFKCQMNPSFSNIYKDICSKLDFSKAIKLLGDKYIKDVLGENYQCVHIRLPDRINEQNMTSKEIAHLHNAVMNLRENNKSLFIASNNIKYLTNLNIIGKSLDSNTEFYSFVDQYICCKSEKFSYMNLDYRKNNKHNRSTFTSFVIDYRLYLDNKLSASNVNICMVL